MHVGDVVNVTILACQLHGIHRVSIAEHDQYDAVLIVTNNNHLYYKGKIIKAKVLRVHEHFIDLIPLL